MSLKTTMAAAINWALDKGIYADRSYLVNDLAGRRQGPTPLIPAGTPQAFTAGWVALGPELATDGFTRVSLWAEFAIGTGGANMRVRCKGRHTTGGNGYSLPIYNPSIAASPYFQLFEAEYLEWNVDTPADNFVLTWDISNSFPFIYFEIQAGTVGNPACAITAANVTYGWGS